jgi:hypothetical protein
MPENLGVVSDYEPASELSRSTQPWVAPSNVEQLAAWDGDAGAYWAACADRFDEGVAGYREQFVAAAAIDATAKVGSTTCEQHGRSPDRTRRVLRLGSLAHPGAT